MTDTQATIEKLDCRITIEKSLDYAVHSYYYTIDNFRDNYFYFNIPNAMPDKVTEILAIDSNGLTTYQPSVEKTGTDGQTTLLFNNLIKVGNGTPKKLNFSYRAPTSAFRHKGFLSHVAFYRSELIHSIETKSATLTIELPKGAKITNSIGPSLIEEEKITFNKDSLRKDHLYGFPIFFYYEKKWMTALLTMIPLTIGALLSLLFQILKERLEKGGS